MSKVSSLISRKARENVQRRNGASRLHEIIGHKRRCGALPRPTEADVQAMVAAFTAAGGKVTTCAPAFAGPVQNGAGRAAEGWIR
jgi:hypothetical protein